MKPLKPLKPLAKRKPKPRAIPVRSSTVASHHYDPKAKHLTVTFHSGSKYRYSGVDQETADGLGKAESKGGFLHSSIIGKFDTTKL